MFVSSSGLRLHFKVEGDGPTLIAISFAGTPIYQRTFSARLRESFQIILLDLQESGPSDAGSLEALTIESILSDIEAVRVAIGVERIAVVGHSMCGMFPLAYAQHYPDAVWGAVIIACMPAYLRARQSVVTAYWETMASQERKALLAERLAGFDESELNALPPDQAWIQRYIATGPRQFADPTFDWSFFWDDCTVDLDVFQHVAQVVLDEYDPTPAFPTIACPVFVTVGIHDYPVPPILWYPARDALPRVTYHAFERSGHWPQYEEQDTFDERLIAWAATCRGHQHDDTP
jgi:proline iminopeptidase